METVEWLVTPCGPSYLVESFTVEARDGYQIDVAAGDWSQIQGWTHGDDCQTEGVG